MGILEGALLVLVVVWTLVFVILAIASVVILSGVKRSLDKVNNILSDAEDFTHNVSKAGSPIRFISSAFSHFMDKKDSKKKS